MRSVAIILLAAFVGALGLYWSGASALAQPAAPPSAPRYFDPVSVEEKRIFDKIVERSYGSNTAQKEAARRVLNRQLLRTVPRFVPTVAGAGSVAAAGVGVAALGGLAVGVWGVVGMEIYYLPCWECQSSSVYASPEVRFAQGAMAAHSESGNGDRAQAWVTYASANRSAGNQVERAIYGQRRVNKWWTYGSGAGYTYSAQFPDITSLQWPGQIQAVQATPPSYARSANRTESYNHSGSVTYSISGTFQPGSNPASGQRVKTLCPSSPPAVCSSGGPLPTVEAGSWSGPKASTSPTIRTTADEGNRFINSVVADPEAPVVVPEEAPDPDSPPDESTPMPAEMPPDPFEDPEGDPDKDGQPNRTDPDPEGDQDPDGDGDPNEHRPTAPWPATDDPEGDGDPDGDGDPNETNPYPDPPPLPDDDPNADPDEDGEPNTTDPDDDGDGIPDEEDPEPYTPTQPGELPDDHRYADPDEDGEPNRTDPDDDGDGFPDEADPEPVNPAVPADDVDDDDDGIPDRDDPAEKERLKPYAVPISPVGAPDQDGDGYSDEQDPKPAEPLVPDPDHDNDGTPNKTDRNDDMDRRIEPQPDPANPTEPGDPVDPNNPSRPGNPGDPAVAGEPANPSERPWNPPTDQAPMDPGDTSNPNVPETPDAGADPVPGEPGWPEAGGGGGGGDETAACETIQPYRFDLPELQLFNVFPFSLILKAWLLFQSLVATPERPSFDLPMFGTVTVPPAMDAGIGWFRAAVTVTFLMGMCFMFYRSISGAGGGGS